MEPNHFASDSTTSDHERLQGKWRSVAVETLGYPRTEHTENVMIFAEDRMTTADDAVFQFRLDSSAQPKQIDFFDANAEKPRYYGIYAFEGDQLIICLSYALPRPAFFSTSKDVTNYLTVFER